MGLGNRGFDSVSLWVLAANAHAIRFYENAGFVLDAGSAQTFELGGRPVQELHYALTTAACRSAAVNRRIEPTDGVIARCQEWIGVNYAASNPVQAMIDRSGLPSRTFSRRFQSATGRSPIDYVQALRIEEAKQMLETSSDPVEDISAEVGYQDSAAFRRTFRKLSGTTPADYRRRFSGLRLGA